MNNQAKQIMNSIINLLINKYSVEVEDICSSSIYEDLGLDSLTLLEITATLEKEYKVKIPMGVITFDMSIEESTANILKNVT